MKNIMDFVKGVYFPLDNADESMSSLRLKHFLHHSSNDITKVGPSRAALSMQVKRASYTAGYLWAECASNIILPNPCEWGWKRHELGHLVPQWLPDFSNNNQEQLLVTCSCKSKKCLNCKCAKQKMPCLPLCGCFMECNRK